MKFKTVIGFLLVAFALAGIVAWGVKTFKKDVPVPVAVLPGISAKEVVYYFYTNYRCDTCRMLEA